MIFSKISCNSIWQQIFLWWFSVSFFFSPTQRSSCDLWVRGPLQFQIWAPAFKLLIYQYQKINNLSQKTPKLNFFQIWISGIFRWRTDSTSSPEKSPSSLGKLAGKARRLNHGMGFTHSVIFWFLGGENWRNFRGEMPFF